MDLRDILEKYKVGEIELEEAMSHFKNQGIEDMGFANLDLLPVVHPHDQFMTSGLAPGQSE